MGLMIPHSYTVDIANGTKKEKITNALIYGDADSHEVTVTVLSGGIAAVMTGYSGILYAVRMADRVTIPNEATIVGNVVTAKLAQGCLLARGRVDLLLTLTKDGDSVSPLWVEATCAGGITDTIADPAEIIPTLNDLLAQISSMEAATDDANTAAGAATAAAANIGAAIAPAYSPSSTYALGAVCTCLGKRYKCTTAITAAEAWTAGHWTAEDVQTVLDDHGSQLADITNTFAANSSGGVVSGGVVTAQGAPAQSVGISACRYITDEGNYFYIAEDATFALAAADGSNPRYDLITADEAGALSHTEGTAGAVPVVPDTPAHHKLLAIIYRSASDNTVAKTDIIDARTLLYDFNSQFDNSITDNPAIIDSVANRPISVSLSDGAESEVDLYHVGTNYIDFAHLTVAKLGRTPSIAYQDGGAVYTATQTYSYIIYAVPVLPNVKQTLAYNIVRDAQAYGQVGIGSAGDAISEMTYGSRVSSTTDGNTFITFTPTADVVYLKVYINAANATGVVTIKNVMVGYGEDVSAANYSAFAGYTKAVVPITSEVGAITLFGYGTMDLLLTTAEGMTVAYTRDLPADLTELASQVDALDTQLNGITYGLTTEADMESFVESFDALGNAYSFRFALQTDTHLSRADNTILPRLRDLPALSKLTELDLTAHLGDLVHGYYPLPWQKDDIGRALSVLHTADCPHIQVVGNHDDNSWYTINESRNLLRDVMTPQAWYDMVLMRGINDGPSLVPGRRYYSYDLYDQNVRVIVLDTLDVDYDGGMYGHYVYGISQTQLDWLVDCLTTFRTSGRLLVLSHAPLHGQDGTITVRNDDLVRGILEAFMAGSTFSDSNTYVDPYDYFDASVNVDFAAQGKRLVIGCFAGHSHFDKKYTINGITHIQTLNACFVTGEDAAKESLNVIDAVSVLYSAGYQTATVSVKRLGYWDTGDGDFSAVGVRTYVATIA